MTPVTALSITFMGVTTPGLQLHGVTYKGGFGGHFVLSGNPPMLVRQEGLTTGVSNGKLAGRHNCKEDREKFVPRQ